MILFIIFRYFTNINITIIFSVTMEKEKYLLSINVTFFLVYHISFFLTRDFLDKRKFLSEYYYTYSILCSNKSHNVIKKKPIFMHILVFSARFYSECIIYLV